MSPCRLLFASALLANSTILSATVTIAVTDQHGAPLADAVIEIADTQPTVENTDDIAIVDQIDKAFVPDQLVIQQGQLVDFPNSDNIRHHVYSFSKAKAFELKLYADKPEQPVRFDQHGVVVLGCNIHDTMVGYIYVAGDKRVETTNEDGLAHFADDIQRVSVWHAHQTTGPEQLTHYDLGQLNQTREGRYQVTVDVMPPPPRDTFKDTFGENFQP
ncbi:Protein containing plastocyanin/azurin family domain [Methylophaga frappieri]|uniref:Protein containing plastocyanin/azurin family domain n=1 Tax=Methylophaga frappieri (strain ATCC BAA-2434 / DSM 25690 / JAM7) TaxID=754477 RepID=I1YH15_METFJ|nr:methylamine utilization protein [Methylophaga frappieri]AFJ02208.1 Protein containing plastocyanin/azurin family domain [Methylophaga frappieri]